MKRTLILLVSMALGGCGGESTTDENDVLIPPADALMDTNVPDVGVPVDRGVIDMAMPTPDAAAPVPDVAMLLPDMGIPVEIAQCEVALGGDPWETMVAESQPGIEDDLASVDIDRLPDTVEIGQINKLFRGTLAYALDIPPEELGDTLEKADILARGALGRVAAASLVLGEMDPTGIDFLFLRRGLHRYYHCDRDFPLTLDGFRSSIFDFPESTPSDIDSIAKCGTRRIYVNADAGAYVAESLVDGAVRETEILLQNRRRDGNLDFLVYDSNGRLTDRTRFPTRQGERHVMGAAPYVCTACHTNLDRTEHTIGYDVLFPDVGPCAQ